MDINSIKPVLAVLVPLICAIAIVLFRKHKNAREACTITASVAEFLLITSMVPAVTSGNKLYYTLTPIIPGIPFELHLDAFGLFFGFLASLLWILTSVYSIGYMRSLKEHAQTRYFLFFAVAISSTIGVAFSGNLLTFFVFYEMLTLSVYPLVIHKETQEAKRAGIKYLAYTLSGGVVILLGIILTYTFTNTLEFIEGGFIEGHASNEMLQILFMIFVIGFGVKSAIMPLHAWLPAAMVAPTPVSALLHAVAVVKAGVFGIIRIIYFVYGNELVSELGVGIPLAYFVSLTIVLGSMLALLQNNLKKRLAYSTISQLSYIIVGASLLTPHGLFGSILHMAYHAFMKITLFFCAGAIYVVTKKEDISEMDGIGRIMPYTMAAFSLCAFGLIGIPPIGGFLSKWYLSAGAIEANELFFVLLFVVSSLLNAAYFLPIVVNAFFKPVDVNQGRKEAPALMLLPLILTAAFSIIFCVLPEAFNPILEIAIEVIRDVGWS